MQRAGLWGWSGPSYGRSRRDGAAVAAAHLVWPPPPAGPCAWPSSAPRRTASRCGPPPPTAGRTCSTTRCHTLRGHARDHVHRICWTNAKVRQAEENVGFKTRTHTRTRTRAHTRTLARTPSHTHTHTNYLAVRDNKGRSGEGRKG